MSGRQRRRQGRFEGFEAFRLSRLLCKLSRCSSLRLASDLGDETEPVLEGGVGGGGISGQHAAVFMAESVYRARRGGDCCRVFDEVSRVIVSMLPEDELEGIARRPLEPLISGVARGYQGNVYGLAGLLSSIWRYVRKPSLGSLVDLAGAILREASRPCSLNPVLEDEIRRYESRMKAYGVGLALLIPAYIVAPVFFGPLSFVPLGMATAALWWVMRRDGARFYLLNVERGWSACRLSSEDLEEIVLGASPISRAYKDLLGMDVRRMFRS
ncbi:hypothetical protein [Aeropyrum camini]|uniref:Uncharacterized protein n=1 Tax=Aeropyrum camini SY1 = JCM 12091 TaxID=1198449 RepID=U3TET7_9CREN|nr:hypothetical protein [Aeropyrum camini]BAN90478.1 hypothetical protein ACAM_1009 [Aeropyrum camini SY1 = JCM 12091]